jgi:hypothetical protein
VKSLVAVLFVFLSVSAQAAPSHYFCSGEIGIELEIDGKNAKVIPSEIDPQGPLFDAVLASEQGDNHFFIYEGKMEDGAWVKLEVPRGMVSSDARHQTIFMHHSYDGSDWYESLYSCN